MIKRFVIAGLIMGALVGAVWWFNFSFKPQMIADFMSKMTPPAASVTAEPAKLERWPDRVHAVGTLDATQGLWIAPEVGGIVSEYYFDSGQDVEEGKRLVQLDISVEQADLKSNKATLKEAELNLARQQSLVQRRASSIATLESAVAKRDSAKAAVERIEALIAQKTILAPISGQLGLRNVDQGQYVSPGEKLVSLQALDPLWIDFPVPEGEVADFKVGAKIEVTVDTYDGEVFEGEVEAFDARLSQENRTLMVRGRLNNKDRRLLPGMFAEVSVIAGDTHERVTVPRTAVTYSLYGDSVWVLKDAGPEAESNISGPSESAGPGAALAAEAPANAEAKEEAKQDTTDGVKGDAKDERPTLTVEQRFVRVGPSQKGRVAILEGIEAGEQVVTSGQLKLQPGSAVTVDNAGALKPSKQLPKQ
ncbi:efflux RND transporter periplasmic adaptor subunit [Methyloceanibacter sp.]|uniref:efflux RND transporter periplasmic adaptor subunit n=1 Tax=Methyloceanibacter sp. TaxID=1965321 RepID=UPI002CBE64BE|nr:efflux RND transporter periplasmic adaptor subunit [Methyloceanibacter sp.]HML92063.1 efflux RND transporter periplasmic adaptor subunit [Methyloceanibacter sp.]